MEFKFLKGEHTFTQFIESSSDLIITINRNAEVLYMNPSAKRFLNKSAENFTGNYLTECVPDQYRDIILKEINNLSVKRKVDSIFHFPYCSDQGEFEMMSHRLSQIDGSEEFLIQSTPVAKVSEQSKFNASEINDLVEIMNLGKIEINKSGIVIKAYTKFCSMVGYEENDLRGTSLAELLLDRTGRLVMQRLLKQVFSGRISKKEFSVRTKAGDKRRVIVYGIPIPRDGRQVEIASCIFQDITERRQNEIDYRKAKSLAEREMNAERNFLATMSHEIRTPLNAILGMTDLLYDTEPTHTQLKYLDSVSHAAKMLNNLLSDILDSSKLENGKINLFEEPFSLEDTLDGIFQAFQFSTPSSVHIEKHIEAPEVMVLGDAKKISQVLMNLVGNAIKFTPKGKIQIKSKVLKDNKDIVTIRFSVRDSGIGIPEEDFENIFSRFKQVEGSIDRKYGGSGLGLFISNRLVNLMDSKLEVISEIGKGSEFSFTIDFAKCPEESYCKINNLNKLSTQDFSGLNVLVAEDNELNQQFIGSLLRKFNIQFDMANNGIEAIQISQDKKFDLILMDLQMPECDGFQASRTIRKSMNNPNRTVPIVACTASGLFNEQKEAYDAGMDDFLTKPFSQRKFLEVINQYAPKENDESIDYLNFKLLFEMFDNDEEQIMNMVQVFLSKSDDLIKEIIEAFDSNSITKIYYVSHKYKPSFGMVGLETVQKQLFELEQISKNKITNEKARVLIESLRKDIPAAVSQLKQTFNDESIRHNELLNSRG